MKGPGDLSASIAIDMKQVRLLQSSEVARKDNLVRSIMVSALMR